MNEFYTLTRHDVLQSSDEILTMLERISDLNFFDSFELYNSLDEFKIKASEEVMIRIKAFHQSTRNVNLKFPDIRELLLN